MSFKVQGQGFDLAVLVMLILKLLVLRVTTPNSWLRIEILPLPKLLQLDQ
jgi:hypothetical protein